VRHLPPHGAVEDVLGREAAEAHVGAVRRPHREQRGAASHNSVECGTASRVGPRRRVEEVCEPLQGGLQAHQCGASQEPVGRTHVDIDREDAHLSRPEPGGGAAALVRDALRASDSGAQSDGDGDLTTGWEKV
jgi:hypothetical protein